VAPAAGHQVVDPLVPAPEVPRHHLHAHPGLDVQRTGAGQTLNHALDEFVENLWRNGKDEARGAIVGSSHLALPARRSSRPGQQFALAPTLVPGDFGRRFEASKAAKNPASRRYSWGETRTPDLTIMSRAL
jgi:hypothetical protein